MMKEYFRDKKYFGSEMNKTFSKLIISAVDNNESNDFQRLIEYILLIESYKFPVAYAMAPNELGIMIATATFQPSDEIINKLKNYIGDEITEKYINYLIDENHKLKNLINEIKIINELSSRSDPKKLDINQINQFRVFANNMDNIFLYGQYPGKMFFFAYWDENENYPKSAKPFWVLDMGIPKSPEDFDKNYIEEDSNEKKRKRRNDNNHTIKNHLRDIFLLDMNEIEKSEVLNKQYESICDIIESIKFNTLEIEEPKQRKTENNSDNRIKSTHFFKMFGTYINSQQENNVEQLPGKQPPKTWSRKGMPLDLFDNSGNNILSLVDPKISSYQRDMNAFIFALQRALAKNEPRKSVLFSTAIYECFKWYSLLPREIEDAYIQHWNSELAEFLNQSQPLFKFSFHEKDQEEPNLFSRILLELLKMKVWNDVRSVEYILNNSKIIMSPLKSSQMKHYKHFRNYMRENSMRESGNDAHCIKYDYNTLYKLLTDRLKDFIFNIIPKNVNFDHCFRKARNLMQVIIHPWMKSVSIFQFIALMQCCAESAESTLTIQHYGLKRGKREVKLSTIMNQPKNNACKEVRLFLVYLVQRRNLLNETSLETVNMIDQYILKQRQYICEEIDKIKCWRDIFTNFESPNEVPAYLNLP